MGCLLIGGRSFGPALRADARITGFVDPKALLIASCAFGPQLEAMEGSGWRGRYGNPIGGDAFGVGK